VKVDEVQASTVAYIDTVRFAQNLHLDPNTHCQQCDWAQPWDGKAMIEHALTHIEFDRLQDLLADTGCLDCIVAAIDSGFNRATCGEH